MSEQIVEYVTMFISTVIPTTIVELARRFDVVKKCTDENELADSMVSDILNECNSNDLSELQENVDLTKRTILTQPGYAPPTPVQQLQIDLIRLFTDMRNDIIDEVKGTIKEELRMEMFLEMQAMFDDRLAQETAPNYNARESKVAPNDNFPFRIDTSKMPTFDASLLMIDNDFLGFEKNK